MRLINGEFSSFISLIDIIFLRNGILKGLRRETHLFTIEDE